MPEKECPGLLNYQKKKPKNIPLKKSLAEMITGILKLKNNKSPDSFSLMSLRLCET